jgi:CBS domain-containing protein
MKIESVMTKPAHACAPTDSLHTAAEIMWSTDCGCVPVTDSEQRVVGIVTDRDICMAAHLEGEPLRARTVDSIMSNVVCVCAADDSLRDVARVMGEKQLRRLPVIDGDGRLAGIVSLNDLALAADGSSGGKDASGLSRDEIAATLAAISRHRPSHGSSEPQ